MRWTIDFDSSKAIVIVKVTGLILAPETAEMAAQGIALAREKNCHKFLIDYTAAEVGDSTLDTYQFMAGLEKLGIRHDDRIGIVHSEDTREHYFAETVALNRGWSNIKYFFDVGSATSWLMKQA